MKSLTFIFLVTFFSFLILYSTNIKAQSYDKTPISIADLKRGFINIQYLRTVLLEKGFEFDKKDDENEFWDIKIDGANEYHLKQIAIQICNYKSIRRKLVLIQIRNDLLPKYNEVFSTLVKTSFPLKKAELIKVGKPENGVVKLKDDYKLIYYNTNSNIEVNIKEAGFWSLYNFELSY